MLECQGHIPGHGTRPHPGTRDKATSRDTGQGHIPGHGTRPHPGTRDKATSRDTGQGHIPGHGTRPHPGTRDKATSRDTGQGHIPGHGTRPHPGTRDKATSRDTGQGHIPGHGTRPHPGTRDKATSRDTGQGHIPGHGTRPHPGTRDKATSRDTGQGHIPGHGTRPHPGTWDKATSRDTGQGHILGHGTRPHPGTRDKATSRDTGQGHIPGHGTRPHPGTRDKATSRDTGQGHIPGHGTRPHPGTRDVFFFFWNSECHVMSILQTGLLLSGRLRLKMQKIHRVNLVRLNLLKSREIIERHWIRPRRKPARSVQKKYGDAFKNDFRARLGVMMKIHSRFIARPLNRFTHVESIQPGFQVLSNGHESIQRTRFNGFKFNRRRPVGVRCFLLYPSRNDEVSGQAAAEFKVELFGTKKLSLTLKRNGRRFMTAPTWSKRVRTGSGFRVECISCERFNQDRSRLPLCWSMRVQHKVSVLKHGFWSFTTPPPPPPPSIRYLFSKLLRTFSTSPKTSNVHRLRKSKRKTAYRS